MITAPAPAARFYSALPGEGVVLYVDLATGESAPLDNDGHHSPDGFAWGYSGSGPAQLARSVLADVLGFTPPPSLYQAYKDQHVATVRPTDPWGAQALAVRRWAAAEADLDPWGLGWAGCLCSAALRPADAHCRGCPAHPAFVELLW